VPKTELLDQIWGNRFVSESALSSRIKSARRAVGDTGRDQRIIKTIYGRGYRFVADVLEKPRFDGPAHGEAAAGPGLGAAESAYEHDAGQVTKAEVRAIAVAALAVRERGQDALLPRLTAHIQQSLLACCGPASVTRSIPYLV